MFWFMLIALVAVVAAVALAVLGDGGALKDSTPDRIEDRLPPDRPLVRADVDAVRLPVGLRGYRMLDVDEVLERLGAELAERDARIADLEAHLAGAHAGAPRYEAPGPGGGVPAVPPGAPGPGYGYGYGYGSTPGGGYGEAPARPAPGPNDFPGDAGE
ncbi:hypothetical protein SAMN05216223_102169 [Actinacidiphila yanglinensis]|uniref:DivIVA domain-containing protein n=1 Tax=Actinacidiphila yanglinensis TaxID=310779 RepID=A0A1H5V5Z0_9ACTN|nr:cell division protein DivIVA [Actinacidiphila yanglinensis]SEF82832.1 hypothetical protein SAMN05216223_102169 [Actinacidiphila yanglinensis]